MARTGSFRQTLRKAIRKSNLKAKQKLTLRLSMVFNPEIREAVEEHLIAVAADAGITVTANVEDPTVDPTFDLDQLERLLQILIEYLPQLIAIFEKFFLSDGAVIAVK